MTISGHTKVYGHLADPVEHVRTPGVFTRWFAAHGVDAVCIPLHVNAAGLAVFTRAMRDWQNLVGFGITMPHKTAIVAHLDIIGPRAQAVGAVNVVRRNSDGGLEGESFDGVGFVAGLRAASIEPGGRQTAVLGAGGAGRAVAFALAEAGAGELEIVNRTQRTAVDLATDIAAIYPSTTVRAVEALSPEVEIVVNCTSLGLHPDDPLPIAESELRADRVIADIIMKPRATKLLRRAARRGATVHYGLPMLEGQIGPTMDFLGITYDTPEEATTP